MKQFIQFKKQRSLGDILTDSFAFVRNEYKPLFKALVQNAAIPFVLLIAATVYYTNSIGDISSLFLGTSASGGANLVISVLFFAVTNMLFIGAFYGTILTYIKSYTENNGIANHEEIRQIVKSKFLSFFGASCLVSIVTGFGLAFCIIPGIYLGVVLSMVFPLMIFNDRSTTDAFSDAFKFIKEEWWITFATLVVMYLIIYFVNMILALPAAIYGMTKSFTSNDVYTPGASLEMVDWIYLTLSTISSAIGYILMSFLVIAIAFIYFNINEKKNQTGTLEEIDSIGSDL